MAIFGESRYLVYLNQIDRFNKLNGGRRIPVVKISRDTFVMVSNLHRINGSIDGNIYCSLYGLRIKFNIGKLVI